MLQCIVYCCRRQSETARLLSANSDLQDKLGSMRQKHSSQLQEGESVGAKVGQRLLVLLLATIHCSFHYVDKVGHHILGLATESRQFCCFL